MSKEKLTIEHLAPYLPYGLEIWVEGYKKTYLMSYILHWSQRNTHRNIGEVLHEDNNCKPILRPLSDLTEEIEHEGEKFIPVKMFARSKEEDIKECRRMKEMELLEYYIIEQLLEWHFDVFSLIEKGLAININDLKDE